MNKGKIKMEQINYAAFRPMDLVFYTEKKGLFGKLYKVGIVVALFEDLYVVEVNEKSLDLRHIEELPISDARRSYSYDSASTAYTAQSILLNDLGRYKVNDSASQYTIAQTMNKNQSVGQYIYLINTLSGVDLGIMPDDISRAHLLSKEFKFNNIFFNKEY